MLFNLYFFLVKAVVTVLTADRGVWLIHMKWDIVTERHVAVKSSNVIYLCFPSQQSLTGHSSAIVLGWKHMF